MPCVPTVVSCPAPDSTNYTVFIPSKETHYLNKNAEVTTWLSVRRRFVIVLDGLHRSDRLGCKTVERAMRFKVEQKSNKINSSRGVDEEEDQHQSEYKHSASFVPDRVSAAVTPQPLRHRRCAAAQRFPRHSLRTMWETFVLNFHLFTNKVDFASYSASPGNIETQYS